MKNQYATILLAFVLALGVAAEGQLRHDGSLDVPFEFVAAGKVLPAGTYKIGTLSEHGLKGLTLGSFENRSSVYLLPTQFESSSYSNMKLSFEQVGDTHVLTSIQTPQGVYLIPTSGSATALAKAKHAEGTTAVGAK